MTENFDKIETLEQLRELLHLNILSTIETFCCLETIKDLEAGIEPNMKMIKSLLELKN